MCRKCPVITMVPFYILQIQEGTVQVYSRGKPEKLFHTTTFSVKVQVYSRGKPEKLFHTTTFSVKLHQ